MKSTITAAILLYSATGLAGDLSCHNHDSILKINYFKDGEVKVVQLKHEGATSFTGKKIKTSSDFFKVSNYGLASEGQYAELEVSETPVLSHFPTCRARICPGYFGSKKPYANKEITAELTFAGKVSLYDCQEI